jgi:hypothetical protein
VREAEWAMLRRVGASKKRTLAVQTNIAYAYQMLGRLEEALSMERDVYSGRLKLHGEEHGYTVRAAHNYAAGLMTLNRIREAKPLLRKSIPVARRVLGENNEVTLRLRLTYAQSQCLDNATLDDLRKAVTTLEEMERTARRIFGATHPLSLDLTVALRASRAAFAAREGEQVESLREAVAAMTPGDA